MPDTAQHTRGPWLIGREDKNGIRIVSESANNLAQMGRVLAWASAPLLPSRSGETEDEYEARREAEGEANARLISAAPDLLAALTEAAEFQNEDTECCLGPFADKNEECPDRRCKDNGCMVARVNRWRAVLAKATGAANA